MRVTGVRPKRVFRGDCGRLVGDRGREMRGLTGEVVKTRRSCGEEIWRRRRPRTGRVGTFCRPRR